AESLAEARDAAEAIKVTYEVLPAVVDLASATKKGQPAIHDASPDNQVFDWHLGDKAATDAAFKKAKHVTRLDILNNRLVPNAMEPRAAIGDYNAGEDAFTLYTTRQNPHVARLVMR
ncbi:MAG TPA: molybdopterin-dependent oxidoreductase, partial [Sphingopyxis terrae]|nr:molybdopterin-dependent oxidoreductase [Sphingopyxis terrae]